MIHAIQSLTSIRVMTDFFASSSSLTSQFKQTAENLAYYQRLERFNSRSRRILISIAKG